MTGAALGAAALIGAFYTFSPMTCWIAVWMVLVVRWAVSGTSGVERRWLLGLFAVALGLRAAAIAVLPFLVDSTRHAYTTYTGDPLYAIQRSIWIRNIYLGVPVAARDYIEAFEPVFGWSGYNYFLAFLHVLFGPSPYGIALCSTGLFLTAAVMVYRQCRASFGSLSAFFGLAVLLLLPSWFVWSVAPLKEAMQFFLLATAMIATLAVVRGRHLAKMVAAATIAAAIVASGLVRNGGAAFAAIGSGLGIGLWVVTRRRWVWLTLAFALPLVALQLAQIDAVNGVVASTVRMSGIRHIGHTRSPGFSYRLLDEPFYFDPALLSSDHVFTMTRDEGVRFLVRSVVAFFAIPVPWRLESATWLVMMPQQTVWYLMVLLAGIGVVAGAKQDALLTCMLAGFILGAVIVIAPNSGNVGTLIRHRDMVAPFVSALAGVGAVKVGMRLVG